MTALRALLCILLLSGTAQAQSVGNFVQGSFATTTVQVLTATSTAAVSGAAVRNMSFSYDSAATATTGVLGTVFPVAGTLSNIRFSVVGGVTGAQTWAAEIVKNGSTNVIGCTVNSTTDPCFTSTPGSVSANDVAVLVATPSGAPTNAILQVTVDFTPTTPGDTILPAGNVTAFSTTAAQAMSLMSSLGPGTAAARSVNLLAEAGTVDLLTAATNAPTTGSYAYNANQNASPSTVTCTIATVTTACQDTTDSFTNADGDNVEFVGTPSSPGTGALGAFSVRWRASSTGDFAFVPTGTYVSDSATVTEYWTLGGVMNATEASAQSLVNNMTITKIEVKLPSAPGAAKSRAFTLRDNGVDTALTCTVSGASATTCSITGSVAVAFHDLLSISDIPSGSPSAIHPAMGLIAHR